MNTYLSGETAIPEQDLAQWRRYLEKNTGIQLLPSQDVIFQTQVSQRMKELCISSPQVYFNYLQMDTEGMAEWQVLVDRLVVKETFFFRHRPSIDAVKQLLQNRLLRGEQKDSFELLSVGCSTGEEPYALAASVRSCFDASDAPPYFGVTALDISLPALVTAKRGIYSASSLRALNQSEIRTYFEPLEKNKFKVRDFIKSRVCFSQVNVLHLAKKPVQLMDVIYCQNLLIYFRRWRRRQILNELVKRLKPGGILILGLGEVTEWENTKVQRLANKDVHAYVKYSQ